MLDTDPRRGREYYQNLGRRPTNARHQVPIRRRNRMVIKPMIRNNLCMNAHPVGARTQVEEYINYVKSQPTIENGPKRSW